jgi:hypothetical protein
MWQAGGLGQAHGYVCVCPLLKEQAKTHVCAHVGQCKEFPICAGAWRQWPQWLGMCVDTPTAHADQQLGIGLPQLHSLEQLVLLVSSMCEHERILPQFTQVITGCRRRRSDLVSLNTSPPSSSSSSSGGGFSLSRS